MLYWPATSKVLLFYLAAVDKMPHGLCPNRRESIWLEIPEVVPSAQFAPQLVVKSPPDLAQPAPTQVTAQAVFVPVLINGL